MLEIEDIGMDEFRKTLTYLEKSFPKQSKQLLAKVGNKARIIVRKKARDTVGKKSGNYLKSIKRGKVFKSSGDELTVRVYHNNRIAPHYHLIEYGHRIVTKDGREVGFKQGYHVFDKSKAEIESQYTSIVESELDKIFNKL